MASQTPFHEGERAIQERAGETLKAAGHSGMIAAAIMPGAIPFLGAQPWAIFGATDPDQQLWCSAWVGTPGFVQADPEGRTLQVDLLKAPLHPGNPLRSALVVGKHLGLLFIELARRKRLRVNGRLTQATPEHLRLAVQEAYPNCPQFIQRHTLEALQKPASSTLAAASGSHLGPAEQDRIRTADTLFLATQHPERGADASHRGGPRGFVDVVNPTTLRIPDYPGNGLFNSFGNLAVDSRMGLLVPDFASGALLHLSGHGQVLWGAADPDNRTLGSQRLLQFRVERWVLNPGMPATS